MPVEIVVSIRKGDRLEAPADVGTLDSHERPVQWPAKGYRDDTGWQRARHLLSLISVFGPSRETRNARPDRYGGFFLENLSDQ